MTSGALAVLCVGCLVALMAAALWLRAAAPPDQWLLHVRNGRLLNAGIGISVWKRPGDSAAVRREGAERARRQELESQARLDRESALLHQAELETEKGLQLMRLAHARELAERERESARDAALAEEACKLEVARASTVREALVLDERLRRLRLEAAAQADATTALSTAEEAKSHALRAYELSRLATERMSDAMSKLPIKDARWVTVGTETPAGSLAALISVVREAGSAASAGG